MKTTMSFTRRTGLALAAMACMLVQGQALAQTYPTKPIKFVVPITPGGSNDVLARTIAQKLSDQWKQAVVVENRPGGGMNLGSDMVAKSAPDGYTWLLGANNIFVTNPHVGKMPFDVFKDLAPVTTVAIVPFVLAVNANFPAKNVAELVEYAKKNPGRLNYASSGNGTIVQLTAELFKSQAGLYVVHIPYKGTALAMPDLISGKIDVLFDSLPTGLPHVKEGRLRALGVTSAQRTSMAPGLPAIAEVLPGYESNTWFGLFGPAGVRPEIVNRVNAAALQALADPEVKDKLLRLGIEPIGSSPMQFATMLSAESAKWKKIITDRKITLE